MGSSSSTDDPLYVLEKSDEWLDREIYPLTTIGQKFELNCGRTLGFHVYGETIHTSIRATILFFPGDPGCRFFEFEPHLKLLKHYGIRFISVERPGIGLSSVDKSFTFDSYADDIHEFIEYITDNNELLNIHTYHVMAYSGGGPLALVFCAKYAKYIKVNDIASDNESKNNEQSLLKSLTIVSSIGPISTPNASSNMNVMNKISWWLVANHKSITRYAAKYELDEMDKNTIKCQTNYLKEWNIKQCFSECDQRSAIMKCRLICDYEFLAYEHSKDALTDFYILVGKEWNAVLSNIVCPTSIFQGVNDQSCTPQMAQYIFKLICGQRAEDVPISDMDTMEVIAGNVETEVKLDDEEEIKQNDSNNTSVDMENSVMNNLQHEYELREQMQNNDNKHCQIIWGEKQSHLMIFEEKYWLQMIQRVLFYELK